SVTGTVVPRTPELGVIEVSDGAMMVNAAFSVTVPPEVITVMVRAGGCDDAVPEMVNVAVIELPFAAGGIPETVTPFPETVSDVTGFRFAPVIVTATAWPRSPEAGVIPVAVGGGMTPANSTAP